MFLSIRKSSFFIILILSGCVAPCQYQTKAAAPGEWHTCLDAPPPPPCFRFWETFDDPHLTAIIEKAGCPLAAEISRSYIDLRTSQQKLKILQESLDVQKRSIKTDEGLVKKGFLTALDQNETQIALASLTMQQSNLELSIKKSIFHISSLSGYAPGDLFDTLSPIGDLPEPVCSIYVRPPQDVKCKNYEEIEIALATLIFSAENLSAAEDIKNLKKDSYDLTRDLFRRGLKDEREMTQSLQELLNHEMALIDKKAAFLIAIIDLYDRMG